MIDHQAYKDRRDKALVMASEALDIRSTTTWEQAQEAIDYLFIDVIGMNQVDIPDISNGKLWGVLEAINQDALRSELRTIVKGK